MESSSSYYLTSKLNKIKGTFFYWNKEWIVVQSNLTNKLDA